MIPAKEDAVWIRILKDDKQHAFESFPLGMLMSRLKRSIKRDQSQENINKCVDEMHAFFIKYEQILDHDMKLIF